MTERLFACLVCVALLSGCVPAPADNPGTVKPGKPEEPAETSDVPDEASSEIDGPGEVSEGEAPAEEEKGANSDLVEEPETPAEEPGKADKPADENSTTLVEPAVEIKPTKLPEEIFKSDQLTPLNPENTVLLDLPNKRLLLKSYVCLDRGMLEMFLCLKETKEHESILAIDAKAFTIHTGLLALGAETGKPATWDPKFKPASGQKIDIFLHFTDSDGKLQRVAATDWIRNSTYRYYEEEFQTLPADLKLDNDGNLRYDDVNKMLFWYGPMTKKQRAECLTLSKDEKYQKAIKKFYEASQPKKMTAYWIFVGSGFYDDGEVRQYLAEGGYVICVANFAQAMIDVSVSSSASGQESLVFEAWHERLPPLGSEVLVELVPRPAKKKGEGTDGAGKKPEKPTEKKESADDAVPKTDSEATKQE